MSPTRIAVPAAAGRYEIVIGPGALADPASWQGVGRDSLLLIVSNRVVGPLYADRVAAALRPSFAALARLDLADGEGHKTWASVEAIVDKLLEVGADRRAAVLALGGGVVGDVAGFAAACYMRGVDCIQVPTSLLAQVDSSVGGKTAINHARGKNMIGAFHAPIRVVADIDTLATLPQRELIAGMAEIVKYGAVADDAFLGWLEGHVEALLGRDGEALTYAVRRSCELKAAVVGADERETGRRVILNFGHTFAHAIEAGTGYDWLHGEAVGCGMVLASEASRRAGLIDARQARRIVELVGRFGLPTRAPSLGVERYLDWMRSDKKAEAGQIRLVLLDGPGQATAQRVDSAVVASVLRDHETPA